MTLHDQLQQYATRPDAVHFSKKKIKLLGFILARVYDRAAAGQPVQYVQVQEGDSIHTVRDYPEKFTQVIDIWIQRFHRHIKFGHPLHPPQRTATLRKRTPYNKTRRNEKE